MKYGEFMAKLRGGVPHVMLLAGEEPYYIGKAETAILNALLPDEAERAASATQSVRKWQRPAIRSCWQTSRKKS